MSTKKTKVLALAGGIGAGKSFVGSVFREAGVQVLDLDAIAHEEMSPFCSAFNSVCLRWPQVIRGRSIDRKALAEIVFNDPDQRAELEAIVHPHVQHRLERRLESLARNDTYLAFVETPLLLESVKKNAFDGVVVVHAPLEVRIQRITQRDECTREQATARINAQPPQEDLLKLATYQLDTSGDGAVTKLDAESLLTYLEALVYSTPYAQKLAPAPAGSPWDVSRSR